MKNRLPVICISVATLFGFSACNRSGEIKIENRISRTIISNVYWGENYLGGNLKPGETTEFIEIDRSDEKLPAEHRIYFEVEDSVPTTYYTEQKFVVEVGAKLEILLSDTTEFYLLEEI